MKSSSLQISRDALVLWSLPAGALYFLRVGESSVYIFEIFFLAALIFGNLSIPVYLFRALILLTVCFLTSLIAATGAAAVGRNIYLGDFIAPFIRYGELVMMMCFFSRAVEGTTISPQTLRSLVVISAFTPLVLGLVFLFMGDSSVIVFNRYAGYLSNPNYMAAYVAVMLPVILVTTGGYRNTIRYPLILAYFFVGIYSLILAGSNGGWIAFVAAGLVYFATGSRRSLLLVGALAALMVIFADTVTDLIRTAAYHMADSEFHGLRRTGHLILIVVTAGDVSTLGSLDFRESIQSHLIEEFLKSPMTVLFGFGMGHAKWITFDEIGASVAAHNGYINTLLELGFLGAVFLIMSVGQGAMALRPNVNTLRILAGYLLALGTTPALYLPFFWMPVLGAAALDLYERRTDAPK